MMSTNLELNVERTAKATEATRNATSMTGAYDAPELHVVGEALELVQGNFGYTDRDRQYYWR